MVAERPRQDSVPPRVGGPRRIKEINDRHGHAAGDRALVAVANALRLVTRSTAIVGRLGGDEFALLLVRSLEPDTAERFLVRLRSALHEPTQDLDVAVEASAGHVVLTQTSSPSAAMEAADAAMYADKRGRQAGRWVRRPRRRRLGSEW